MMMTLDKRLNISHKAQLEDKTLMDKYNPDKIREVDKEWDHKQELERLEKNVHQETFKLKQHQHKKFNHNEEECFNLDKAKVHR